MVDRGLSGDEEISNDLASILERRLPEGALVSRLADVRLWRIRWQWVTRNV
jgi:hypothetical protein